MGLVGVAVVVVFLRFRLWFKMFLRTTLTEAWPYRNLTFHDSHPALWRFSRSLNAALVEAFIGLGNIVDGHLSRRAGPSVETVFIKISREIASFPLPAQQSHRLSLCHRKSRTLQNHQTCCNAKRHGEAKLIKWHIFTWQNDHFILCQSLRTGSRLHEISLGRAVVLLCYGV